MKIKLFIKDNWKYFIKYSLVGLSGTILDIGGFTLLIRYTALGETLLTRGMAATMSFILAVVNNFTWNKIWTFRDKSQRLYRQFLKFLIVSIGGLTLNIIFLSALSIILALLLEMPANNLPVWASVLAKAGASGIVLAYNFLMNRYWTFNPASTNKDSWTQKV